MVTAFFIKSIKHLENQKAILYLSDPVPSLGAEGIFTAPDHIHARPMDGIYQFFLALAKIL
jgi:hypothetical protein